MKINWNRVSCYKTSDLKKRRDMVRKLDKQGLLFTEIAAKLNVSYSTILHDNEYNKKHKRKRIVK